MDINQKCINELKFLSAEIVSNANSGHTGTAVGAAQILYTLFKDHLVFNPENPEFLNRDRFVMSAGHASALYYATLHLFGYDISVDDLKNFRKLGSKTPGHPECFVTPGVEATTGPLGQGVANAVGLAIKEAHLEAKLSSINPNLIKNKTYCFCGDGCLMEGVAMEACSIAGTLGLNKLILLYDDNNITIDGTRESANNENIAKKFSAMNWNTYTVKNGNDYKACTKAIEKAKHSDKPAIVIFKTTIGEGTKNSGLSKAHAYPMPPEDLAEFKHTLGVTNSFGFSDDVKKHCLKTIEKNISGYDRWNNYVITLKKDDKKNYRVFKKATEPAKINFNNILKKINNIGVEAGRKISNMILNMIAKDDDNLIGGCADVANSTLAKINNGGDFTKENRLGKNIHFGVREHAMGTICNGIALYNDQPVFDSTFLAFSNYMIPPIRMRSMMGLPVLSIFTHDSISIGEDGPTHQPIEQLAHLRTIIDYTVFRPSNNTETVAAFKYFYETKCPTAIVMSKSNLAESLDVSIDDAMKGAYIIYENSKEPEILIISTGTDVELAIKTAKLLNDKTIRVVSMPCESLFDVQSQRYINKVMGNPKLTVTIEASNDPRWNGLSNDKLFVVDVSAYNKSGKGSEIYKKAGFDENRLAKEILEILK